MPDHPSYPITPPPELVQQWRDLPEYLTTKLQGIATQAARWGADQELEACCEWLTTTAMTKPWETVAQLANELRAARRPKPPSLKEQAFDGLRNIEANIPQSLRAFEDSCDTIRRALEALPE